MKNLTAEALLASLGIPATKQVEKDYTEYSLDEEDNKEFVFNDSAKMYSSSSSNKKKKEKKKQNTFQQSTQSSTSNYVNVRGKAPALSSGASHQAVREDREEIPEQRYGRKLSLQNDKIVEMRLQLKEFKIGKRHTRVKAYLSIKSDVDTRYMIFMTSSLTNALDETYRGIKRDDDKVLKTIADEFYEEHKNDDLLLGRIKYKVVRGQKVQEHHRKNLPVSLIGVYVENEQLKARVHLLGEDYYFELDDDLSEKQQKFYKFEGIWREDVGTMSISEAFGD